MHLNGDNTNLASRVERAQWVKMTRPGPGRHFLMGCCPADRLVRMSLRVLQVTPYYEEAWGYGGIPRVAAAISRGLARRGHEVTVCTTDACDEQRLAGPPGPRVGPWATTGQDRVMVHVFPNLSNRLAYGRQLFLPLGLRRFLRARAGQFDIAHLHSSHHLPGALAAAELGRAAIPYVLTPNGTAGREEGQRRAKWLFDHTVGRRDLTGASRVIAVSRAERRQLEALGVPRSIVRQVPNPVELEPPGTPPGGGLRQRLGLPFEKIVLYLGTLIPRKCVDVLVRAIARLRQRGVGLVIAGNDLGAGDAVRAVVRRTGLERLVHFTGLLVAEERLELLAGADVLAYPGRAEVFGLAPLEALVCGTPVVVGDDSGCGEVVRDVGGGLLVRPGDPGALAAALSTILDGAPGWRRSARLAGDRVRARFSSDAVAAAVEEVYREVLS